MTRQGKRILLLLGTICLCAVIFYVGLFFYAIASLSNDTERESLTTDTQSADFATAEEKLDFLAPYLTPFGEILDAEHHIIFYDNSGGLVPGPSDWDIRAALKINPDELPLWLEGFSPIPSNEIDLSIWDALPSDTISWDKDAAICYRRENSFAYIITFPDSDIILKAIGTNPYLTGVNPHV